MKKILLTFGTRPEAIKMAPLILELNKHRDKVETIVCVTGQHREMLDQVLSIFKIKPDYDLNIMKKGQDLYDITSKVLLGLRDIFKQTQPDLVLVHGDTTTSMAAALAAYYQQIPVGHVEAGLRTYNIYSPWPEEINRQLIGRISNYNFSPTPTSSANLLKEGVNKTSIYITGNTVIDSLYWVVNKIKSDEQLNIKLKEEIKSFVEEMGIDMSEYKRPIEDYTSFNDFFYRELKDGARKIDYNEDVIVSPADGKILAYQNIKEIDKFSVKGSEFTLEEFFNDKELAKKYEDGTCVIIRLAPADYHRFHFPVDGKISEVKRISGDYYSVSTHAIKTNFRIFCENKREYAILKTEKFGDIAMFDIGATMVGGIIQTYKANSFVKKGEEKGCREMRKRFAAYTKGIPDGSRLRQELVQASTIAEYKTIIQNYFQLT